jgi:hypothetical protein
MRGKGSATTRHLVGAFGVAVLWATPQPVRADDAAHAGGAAGATSVSAEPAAPERADVTRECIGQHERSQEQRLERKLIDARATLRACSRPECPSPIRVDCVTWLDEVENSIPSIVFAARSDRGDETRVRVLVDGELVADRLEGRAMEMDPGAHDVRFELAPYPTVVRSIVVREGERNRVIDARFALPPEPKPPPAPVEPPGPPALAFVLGGMAVAGVGTGIGAGVSALNFGNERENSCAPLCSREDEQELRTRAILADVGWTVGLLAAGGTALVLVRHSQRRDAHSISHRRIGAGGVGTGAGVWLEGEFR